MLVYQNVTQKWEIWNGGVFFWTHMTHPTAFFDSPPPLMDIYCKYDEFTLVVWRGGVLETINFQWFWGAQSQISINEYVSFFWSGGSSQFAPRWDRKKKTAIVKWDFSLEPQVQLCQRSSWHSWRLLESFTQILILIHKKDPGTIWDH